MDGPPGSEPAMATHDIRPAVLHTKMLRPGNRQQTLDWRGRTSYRLLGVLDGTLTGTDPLCRTGEALLVVPGDDPILQVIPGSRVAVVVFDLVPVPMRFQNRRPLRVEDTPQPTPEELWGHSLPLHYAGGFGRHLAHQLQTLCDSFWRSPVDRLRANARLGIIMADLLDRAGADADWRSTGDPADPIFALKNQVMRNLPRLMTVAEMAAATGWSRPHFSREFRQRTGCTPSAWLERIRWREARRQLAETDTPIAEIAHLLRFTNAAAFSTACRRHLGMAPRRWRLTSRLAS